VSDNPDGDGVDREHRDRLSFIGTRTAIVAHEINTPLLATLLAISAAEADLAAHPDAQAAVAAQLASARRALEHIAALVRGLGTYARPSRTRDTTEVRLDAVVADALLLCRLPEQFGYPAPEVEHAPAPPVLGDPTRLVQIVVNLLSNALEAVHASGSGRVWLRTGPAPEGGAMLVVEDDGPGIPEGLRDRLFERFEGERLGVGLWVSRQIAHDHGGSLAHERSPEGRTRFTLWLPALETPSVQL